MQPTQVEYQLFIGRLWSGRSQPIAVAGLPVSIAVTGTGKNYSYLGPFELDATGKAPAITIEEKPVYETKTREAKVWNPQLGQWVIKTYQYTVSHMVQDIRVQGLQNKAESKSLEPAP